MLDYRECSIEDFKEAMKQTNIDVKDISNEHLYILYTKFKADALTCFRARKGYASELGRCSENQAERYKEELKRRGIDV